MKKSSITLLAIACLFSFLFFSLTACGGQSAEKAEAPNTEQPAAQANTSNWPADIPSAVPPFGHGQIGEVTTGNTAENLTWVMRFSGTSEIDVAAYETVLKQQGFKPSTMSLGEKGNMIVGSKDNLTVTINYHDGTTTVGVNQAK
ncbi:MAG: hypothetical protein R2788_06170 [Saprospiraceae bacterium]|jgi:hypothetical protein